MKQLILILCTIVILAGCNEEPITIHSKQLLVECVDGVNYYLFREAAGYQGYGYMAPKYKRDGTISLCDQTTLTQFVDKQQSDIR